VLGRPPRLDRKYQAPLKSERTDFYLKYDFTTMEEEIWPRGIISRSRRGQIDVATRLTRHREEPVERRRPIVVAFCSHVHVQVAPSSSEMMRPKLVPNTVGAVLVPDASLNVWRQPT